MALIDVIKRWGEKNKEKSDKFKEMEEDYRLRKMLEDRQKSSNERELERYYKKQKEESIKKQVEEIHKQQNKESWKGKNLFGGKCTILKEDKKILSNDRPILHKKNMFLDNKTLSPMTKEELFFRW